jgi:glucosyl-3-phosphoglycerate synthase
MLPDLRVPSDWGLEIGILSEAWRNLAPRAVCQVEVADQYDHKHQQLSEENANAGLSRMSIDICKAIFRKLATDGTVFTPNVFRTLKATYYRCALDVLEAYYNDAKMNGLSIDRHAEERSIELFAENIMRAGNVFLDNPHEPPFIPTWNRVHSADPMFMSDMNAAAKADEADFQ